VNSGVYVYLVTVIYYDSTEIFEKGNVTLMR